MRWWPSTIRRLIGVGYGPDGAGSAQAMAAFAEAGRHGGRLVPMAQSHGGYLAPGRLPITSLGAGRVTPSDPRAFPATGSPDGTLVGGSTLDVLWRTSGMGASQ